MDIKDIPSYGNYENGGERIDLGNGYWVRVRIDRDDDMGEPWNEHDGHVVGVRTAQHDMEGRVRKHPGERVLYKGGRNEYTYLYDFNASILTALEEGWGIGSPHADTTGWSKKRIAVTAVERDAEYLRKWLNDEWYWIAVAVAVYYKDTTIHEDSLCGIESYGDYWKETVVELVGPWVENHMEDRRITWRMALKEARAVRYWAARDVVTTC